VENRVIAARSASKGLISPLLALRAPILALRQQWHPSMSVIHTARLSKHYGRRMGLDSADLNVGAGEIFGFLGANGAGKTTAIRLLLGFLRPTHGRATIFGLDCWRDSARIKRDVGYLPGDLRLYPWLTCERAMRIVGRVRGMDLRANGADLAKRFQLEIDLRVRRMSRGTRQKLGLIMALAHKPRLLVLDEPTSGLDPVMQAALANHLRELASAGHTVFFSSHTLSEVETLCDRVAIVQRGRVIANEALESLRSRARRAVELVFADETAAAGAVLPGFLHVDRRDGRKLVCELEGPTAALIQWAGAQPLADMTISPPDLETLFRKFYDVSLDVA
jgi:ABC-2 type transport system ATP-binding protein